MTRKGTARIRLYNGIAAALLLTVEVLIARYCHDAFIRPYGGDVLVIPLLACLWRVVFPVFPRHIGLYMIGAGVMAELWQAFGLVHRLGLDGTVFAVILGTGFSHIDLICYAVGGILYEAAENGLRMRKKKSKE